MNTRPVRTLIGVVLAVASPLLGQAAEPAAIPADRGWVTPAIEAPGVSFHTFESAAAKATDSYYLFTPAAYDREPERRFPVVYWLHGSGGGLRGIPPVAARFAVAIDAGKAPPCLVVFVNGMPNGMYVDWKDGSAPIETVIVKELVPHIDASYRTIASREGRLLDGYSMGGYGAARLGFKHPELFRAISILGGGPLQADLLDDAPRAGRRRAEEVLQRVYGGDREYFRSVSPRVLAEQHAAEIAQGSLVRVVCGDRDATFANNREFHEHLERLGIPHTWTVLPGVDHNPLRTFEALGDATWDFYRQAFAGDAAAEAAAPRGAAESATPAEPPIREGPRPVRPGDHGIGRRLGDVSFTDLAGTRHSLAHVGAGRLVVFAMTSTSCPLSRKYLPRLEELVAASGDRVAWILVNPVATDKPADMQAAAARFGDRAIFVHDPRGALAAAVGAVTTTDVVVVAADRTIAYHGAIDDQYGFGYSLDAPRKRYLADALAAIRAGEEPAVSATEAPGCVLDRPAGDAPATDVTYHGCISRIVARHCVECHRDGGVGPFPLDTYDDLVAHAAMVREVIDRGTMPPWFAAPVPADPETGRVHTPWANDRSLAEAEKRDLAAWLAGGRPAGDPAAAPAPRLYPAGWQIGTPDAVFEFAEPVPVKATGVMPYQTVIVNTHLPEDRWVQAIEVQPGDRNVVHHALIHLSGGEEDATDPRDAAAEARGGFWGEYVPGQNTLVYPDGFAKKLPKHARLKFQMHYTPNGTATTDRTRVGVIYAKEPPRHEVRVAGIVNARIAIPPGAADHREEASLRLPFDATILGFLPHLHVRGKACRYELIRSGGARTTLLDIPRYDFNWQLLYRLHEPLALRAGDRLVFTAWYDNSPGNPANPDPSQTVNWGPQTFDEMHLGYVEYFVPGIPPGAVAPGLRRRGFARPR
jgi:S-formylglutathione hydrolase FrmB/thiol-disulfide isomerase/thioredoxin